MIQSLLLAAVTAVTPITRDTMIMGDTAVVITTVCAPICSSIARTYVINNKEWSLIETITSPNPHWVFPQAYFEENQLRWQDNTPQMLDEEGK